MNGVSIREAGTKDAAAIRALLGGAGLPVPGPRGTPVHFLVAERDGRVIGTAGWEAHGGEALLRSVAVNEGDRGTGIGRRLVDACLGSLERSGIGAITLVTLGAASFFERFAFLPISREDVPEAIRESNEYRIHECAGGTWMRRSDASRADPG